MKELEKAKEYLRTTAMLLFYILKNITVKKSFANMCYHNYFRTLEYSSHLTSLPIRHFVNTYCRNNRLWCRSVLQWQCSYQVR